MSESERRRVTPPARWESWAQTIGTLLVILGTIWAMRGAFDKLLLHQELILQHLCKVESTLYRTTYSDCSGQLRADGSVKP